MYKHMHLTYAYVPDPDSRAGGCQLLLKIPWVDRTRCNRDIDCSAARVCPRGVFQVSPESEEEPGLASDYPQVDLERCRQCGDCARACPEQAVKMV